MPMRLRFKVSWGFYKVNDIIVPLSRLQGQWFIREGFCEEVLPEAAPVHAPEASAEQQSPAGAGEDLATEAHATEEARGRRRRKP